MSTEGEQMEKFEIEPHELKTVYWALHAKRTKIQRDITEGAALWGPVPEWLERLAGREIPKIDAIMARIKETYDFSKDETDGGATDAAKQSDGSDDPAGQEQEGRRGDEAHVSGSSGEFSSDIVIDQSK